MAQEVQALGQALKKKSGVKDIKVLKRLMLVSLFAECFARSLLHLSLGPWIWILAVISLALHLSLESQFMHTIMHGSYSGLPGGENFTPNNFETIGVPLRCKTWGRAHGLHHRFPSLLEIDPDTLHPFYRVHEKIKWRIWNYLNTFLGPLLVFECCALNYDKALKSNSMRRMSDKGELLKFLSFVFYQYFLFPLLAGAHWKYVFFGNLSAVLIRNLVSASLQMASSVGHQVSTVHHDKNISLSLDELIRFQIETSKNFKSYPLWRHFLGGLDRHIEHHLFPSHTPARLHEVTGHIKELSRKNEIKYFEFSSFSASMKDSLSYLHLLSR